MYPGEDPSRVSWIFLFVFWNFQHICKLFEAYRTFLEGSVKLLFFLECVRRPNYQNDRIWAKSVEDITEDERYREMVKNQSCVGVFIMFTCKRLLLGKKKTCRT